MDPMGIGRGPFGSGPTEFRVASMFHGADRFDSLKSAARCFQRFPAVHTGLGEILFHLFRFMV